MKILGIETSSYVFSLCIQQDEKPCVHIMRDRRTETRSRDANFFDKAQKLLQDHDIDVIVVSIGPGMFTSLRVGLCFAKGIAYTKNIPVVAVNSLDVIGYALDFVPGRVTVVINAFHKEVYAAHYVKGIRAGDYLLKPTQEFRSLISDSDVVVGSGVELLEPSLLQNSKMNKVLMKDFYLLSSATRVVNCALPRVREGDFDSIDFLEPFYIKKTDAERFYCKKNAD